MKDFYCNVVVENDDSLTTKMGERKLCLNEEVLSEVLKVPRDGSRSTVEINVPKALCRSAGKCLT